MKKAFKIISIILVVCIVAGGVTFGVLKKDEINYFYSAMHNASVALSDGSWKNAGKTETAENAEVDNAFTAGKYGGVDFKTVDDVVKYYVDACNKTKSKTASYTDDQGNKQTYYALLGTEELKINSVLVEGKENSIINKLVPSVVDSLFKPNVYGLPPCANRDPSQDIDENGESLQTSRITADDILTCSVKDNSDGTITITLVPKETQMSHKGLDAQGKVFNTLGGIDKTVDSISALSWASGTTAENCSVLYSKSTAVAKIDVASGEIVEADYNLNIDINVQHANVAILQDKNASLNISYKQHFPADAEYMMKTKGIKSAQ